MREDDAVRFLLENGLTDDVPGAGSSFSWCHSFFLADGYRLILEISPQPFQPGTHWANGRLEAAIIQRHGSNILTVKLKNAPITHKRQSQ